MSEIDVIDGKVQASKNTYPYVKAVLILGWLCTECYKYNTVGYNNWKVYGGVEECSECEKAHNVKEPWE